MFTTSRNVLVATGLTLILAQRAALAQPYTVNGGEVNISGATLMRPFFVVPASTNDHIDVDGDGCPPGTIPPCPLVDQLAPTFIPGSALNTWWLVQYRGVGSVNGFNEFVNNQTCGTIPTSIPGELGLFNRFQYAATGSITWAGPAADASGTPRTPSSIDLAIVDVESSWAVKNGDPADARWYSSPNNSGYGQNPILSSTGWNSALDDLGRDCDNNGTDDTFLNTNAGSPDADTIFDTRIAWAPIVYTANRGSAVQKLMMSELHHLFVAGRLPNGENLVACTRSSGSGTRNGIMNTSGIDTTWGRGDNLANESNSSSRFLLGPLHQPTNAEGSSLVESAIQNRRLAVGYTGLAGASRAADDALAGRYEIIDVMFDDRGGASYVRPTIDTVLDNADPNTGYQLGGTATLVSRGDPLQTDSEDPTYMDNQAAASYVRNILESVEDFVSAPADPANFGSPGEYLATTYFGIAGLDALPTSNDPSSFIANPDLNQPLQDFIRANNGLGIGQDTPGYGTANQAGLAPTRTVNPAFPDSATQYTDGKGPANAGYCYSTSNLGNGSPATLASGVKLGQRNRIAGDFNNDGLRDLTDADKLVTAYFAPRQFEMGVAHAGNPGDQTVNTVIPEVIGDFNGDGNFDEEDLRYFADGLAVDPGTGMLDRKAGAVAIDNAILFHAPTVDQDGNPVADPRAWLPWGDPARTIVISPATPCDPPKYMFPAPHVNDAGTPFLATGKAYKAGDFRGDVAGGKPVPGAQPLGFDNRVDAKDIDYVCHNAGKWADLDQAVRFDLSADMNGDLAVDASDVAELVEIILETKFGDVNLDGAVDAADEAIINAHIETAGGWAEGDMNCDGVIDEADLEIWKANASPGGQNSLTAAATRRTHGAAGPFNLAASLAPPNTREPRQPGSAAAMVVTFQNPPVATDGTMSCNEFTVTNGTCAGVTVAGNDAIVALSGLTKNTCLTVAVTGIDGFSGDSDVSVVLHEGDSQQNGNVNILDLNAIKNVLNQALSQANVRNDINVNGSINILDLNACKNNLNQPASCP